MNVTNYLTRARECAELAERANANDKLKLLEIAEAWLMLANNAAKAASSAPLAHTSLDSAASLDGKGADTAQRSEKADSVWRNTD